MNLRAVPWVASLLIQACAGFSPDPSYSPELRLTWDKEFLTIRGDFPGGILRVNYLEAFCRSGSSDRVWAETKIPHQTERVFASPDGRTIELRTLVDGGLEVTSRLTAGPGEVDFQVEAVNRGPQFVDAQWVQPCVQVGDFTGTGRDRTRYISQSFIYRDDRRTFLPETRWGLKARYTPGQVYVPAGVSRDDVNPRPQSPDVPSNSLIGCVSGDGRWLFATAWEPCQELFQGVFTCLHSDFRLGGVPSGERRRGRGKIYVMQNDPEALLARYRQDFGRGPSVQSP
jgi:hypothetical protein